jgi:hypothetical protein
MARSKDPKIPDAILDQLLGGADPKTAFGRFEESAGRAGAECGDRPSSCERRGRQTAETATARRR